MTSLRERWGDEGIALVALLATYLSFLATVTLGVLLVAAIILPDVNWIASRPWIVVVALFAVTGELLMYAGAEHETIAAARRSGKLTLRRCATCGIVGGVVALILSGVILAVAMSVAEEAFGAFIAFGLVFLTTLLGNAVALVLLGESAKAAVPSIHAEEPTDDNLGEVTATSRST